MDNNPLQLISAIAQAVSAIFMVAIAFFSFKISDSMLKQEKQSVYLKLYEIVQKHHSQEITDLKACIYSLNDKNMLEEMVEKATKDGVSLRQYDPHFHSKVCALVNYFESLGMFLEYGWKDMPENFKLMMLDMLHNSVSKTWSKIYMYHNDIYQKERSSDWAKSFQWLNSVVEKHRQTYGLR